MVLDDACDSPDNSVLHCDDEYDLLAGQEFALLSMSEGRKPSQESVSG